MPEGINTDEEKIPFDPKKLEGALMVDTTIDEVCEDLSLFTEIVSSNGPQSTDLVIENVRSLYARTISGDLSPKDIIEASNYIDGRGILSPGNDFLAITSNGSLRKTVIEIALGQLSNLDEEICSKLLGKTSSLTEFYGILRLFREINFEGKVMSGEQYSKVLLTTHLRVQTELEGFDEVWHGTRKGPLIENKLAELETDIKKLIDEDAVLVGGIKVNFERLIHELIYQPRTK